MHRKIADLDAAHHAIAVLGQGFFGDPAWVDTCEVVDPAQMPPAARRLLVHEGHMTPTLGEAYGESVALQVLDHRMEGNCYRRKIVLTVESGRRVVEFGIVRLDLSTAGNGVRERIVAQDTPLGDILNQHNVLTQVSPLWYLRFANDAPLMQYFRPPSATPLYGRVGMIYCDGEPAVELLEVVRIDVPEHA